MPVMPVGNDIFQHKLGTMLFGLNQVDRFRGTDVGLYPKRLESIRASFGNKGLQSRGVQECIYWISGYMQCT